MSVLSSESGARKLSAPEIGSAHHKFLQQVALDKTDGLTAEAGDAAGASPAVLEPLSHRVDAIMKEIGVDRKAALKQAARERGLTRREAYKQLLVTRDE